MTDFTISPKAENVWLESWLDLSPAEQKEMDHVEPDEQTSSRFFHYQDSVYDIADFMRDDIGAGEIAGCAQLLFQLFEKPEVEINFFILRTIKWPHRAAGVTAGGLDRAAE